MIVQSPSSFNPRHVTTVEKVIKLTFNGFIKKLNHIFYIVGHIIADCPNPAVPTTYVKKEKQCFNCQQYVILKENYAMLVYLCIVYIGTYC